MHLNSIEMIFQTAIAAAGRHQTGIGFACDCHGGGGQARRRRQIAVRPITDFGERRLTGDVGGNVVEQLHLPGSLLARRAIDVDRRLDKSGLLQVADFTAPDIHIDQRTDGAGALSGPAP